jgi:hypothetical protein
MIESQDARRNQESEQQTHMFKDLYDCKTSSNLDDKRNCTDLCCLFIGFLFTIALLTIGIVGVNISTPPLTQPIKIKSVSPRIPVGRSAESTTPNIPSSTLPILQTS